jgi:hypothetical protein
VYSTQTSKIIPYRARIEVCMCVSTQTRNLPVLELAFPFPVLAPISSTVLFWIPLPEIFHLVRYPNAQFASTGTGRDSFVPFPVLGSASSGTVIHWAPYRNWTLCARSHFRYGALPVPVWSFTGPRTGTGLYARGPIQRSKEECGSASLLVLVSHRSFEQVRARKRRK